MNLKEKNWLAQYIVNGSIFYTDDSIAIKLFSNTNSHIVKSLIHEIAHRIWYMMFNNEDKNKWIKEFYNKKNNAVIEYENILGKKFRLTQIAKGFPSHYSESKPEEYFAEVVAYHIVNNIKYCELLDEIF